MFFAPEKAGGQALGQFVTKPFTCWTKKTQSVNAHAISDNHLTSMTKMKEFLTRYDYPSKVINVPFDNEAKMRMENNKKVLESLF